MKKNINLVIDGIAPEKVIYDTDNHSLAVWYPAQREFKKGDILASDDILLIFDKYVMFNQEKDIFHSLWNNMRIHNRNWTSKYFTYATDEQKAQVYRLLRKEGKRWNAETLQVEDIKKKFKRGDIVYHNNMVSIFSTYTNSAYEFHGLYNVLIDGSPWHIGKFNNQGVRIATTSEQQILFDALKEKGKRWNAKTLEVEDLDISEIVYNLSSACSYLNKPVPDFKSLLLTISNEDFHKYKAQITLQLIREAWNKHDGFEVDWDDNSQEKYYPTIRENGEVTYLYALGNKSIGASCYSFATPKRVIQFGNQFKELFKIALGNDL